MAKKGPGAGEADGSGRRAATVSIGRRNEAAAAAAAAVSRVFALFLVFLVRRC